MPFQQLFIKTIFLLSLLSHAAIAQEPLPGPQDGIRYELTDFMDTVGMDINNRGVVAGYAKYGLESVEEAAFIVRRRDSQIQGVEPNFHYYGNNNRGDVVGIIPTSAGTRIPFVITHAGFTDISRPEAPELTPLDINNRGAVVGSTRPRDGDFPYKDEKAFLLDENGFSILPAPPGATSYFATGINDWGDIVGVFSGDDYFPHGFVYSKGKMRVVDHPDAEFTWLGKINNWGMITGTIPSGFFSGFLLIGDDFIPINLPGLGGFIHGINDLGEITGRLIVSGGVEDLYGAHAFRINSIPQIIEYYRNKDK